MSDAMLQVNMTTDGASPARSARDPTRHLEVGLSVKYDGDCIDHQFHLLVSLLHIYSDPLLILLFRSRNPSSPSQG